MKRVFIILGFATLSFVLASSANLAQRAPAPAPTVPTVMSVDAQNALITEYCTGCVADMANGPRERIQPFPETVKLLVSLGSKFNNRCISC